MELMNYESDNDEGFREVDGLVKQHRRTGGGKKPDWPRWVLLLTVFIILQIAMTGLVVLKFRNQSCDVQPHTDNDGSEVTMIGSTLKTRSSPPKPKPNNVGMTKTEKGINCAVNKDLNCFGGNQELYNSVCYEGDLCFGDEDTGERFGCPIEGAEPNQELFCILKPHGWSANQADIAGFSSERLLALSNATGQWDCKTNTWLPGMQRLPTFNQDTFPKDTYIITYGDSVSHNIFVGLTLIAKDYHLNQWKHNRIDADGGLEMNHFCCFYCECHASSMIMNTAQVVFKLGLNDRLSGRTKPANAVIIIRESLHIHNNVTAMVEEMIMLFDTLEKSAKMDRRKIFVIYIPMHGDGRLKQKQYLPEQGLHNLRVYSARVREKVEAYVAKNIKHVQLHIFEMYKMFQGAECHYGNTLDGCCHGAFESMDGTHLSLTTQVSVANHLIALIHALNNNN